MTRGTTNPNRLRRVDRWIAGTQAARLRRPGPAPIVVDLGYGRAGTTARELHDRLRAVRPDVQVVGLEIEPQRVADAQPLARPGLSFALGGFEVPLPGGACASVIRAFNVLRQYDEPAVPRAWARMITRLEPGGVLIDGTCDEVGRLATWIALDADGPRSLTISLGLRGLQLPSQVAPRLPKVLISRNVPGQGVHDWLAALDEGWTRAAPLAPYGRRQRFLEAVSHVGEQGWPIIGGRSRWRLGEVTVAWAAVAPRGMIETAPPGG
ncbi:hypothetical protein KILIM_027_00260 [Kineosphaera limosa NBRC 100340]|uniref:Methyltransferase n=1 Tax=Kineosphaera limosa NBRC 100340 TaxID=1184609 RepID=K6VI06_9MICO|nr:hypothetical protein KILIM_027_00260 [Kineosphaera limosa NBRC 100340]